MLPSSQSGVGRCTWKSTARNDTGTSYGGYPFPGASVISYSRGAELGTGRPALLADPLAEVRAWHQPASAVALGLPAGSPRRHVLGRHAEYSPRDGAPASRVRDSAAIHQRADARQIRRHEGLVLGVISVHDHGVTRLADAVRLQPELAQLALAVERVMHHRGGTAQGKLADDGEDAGERGLLHAGPVGSAEHGHAEAGQPSGQPGERLHRLARHGVIDLTRRGREARARIAGQIELRVYRDAVPADGYARPVQMAERLAVGRLNDLVHVDAR